MHAAKHALDILKEHDSGFGPAMAIAATRYAAALLASGSPQEAQVGGCRGRGFEPTASCVAGAGGKDEAVRMRPLATGCL